MYHKDSQFLLFAGLVLLLGTAAAAEPVEIYNFANQEAYRVESVEDGKPKLVEAVGVDLSAYAGERHEAWWVTGDLPLDARWAFPLVDYQTKRVANSYADRHLPSRFEVRSIEVAFANRVKGDDPTDSLFVLGWVLDGKITRFSITPSSRNRDYIRLETLVVPEAEFGGFPVCWIVEDGALVERKTILPLDHAILRDADVPIKELAAARNRQGSTALHYAAARGDADLVRRLIAEDKSLVKTLDRGDVSALSHAAGNGRAEVVALLLENKAPLRDGWEKTNSIVREAAKMGHFQTVKLLAPGKPKGDEGRWHYSWAAADALRENYEDIAMYLIEQGADFNVAKENREKFVLSKFAGGHPDLGFRLLEKFKLDATVENEGYNLLHSVAGYADPALLQRVQGAMGSGISQKTASGLLPMDLAVGLGNVEGICWFIDNGGSAPSGKSAIDPMKHAISRGQSSSVECLIGYGYDVNKEVGPDLTPLMFALYLREFDIARRIAAAGGIFLMDSPHLDLVVARLAESGDFELASKLVEQGWTSDRLVHGAFSLADCAAFFESGSILENLKSRGWDVVSGKMIQVGDTEVKPRPESAIAVEYPADLQEKYGARNVLTHIGLAANGVPMLVKVEVDAAESELAPIIEQAVYNMRFSPAQVSEKAVPVSMKVRIPLTPDFDPESVFSMNDVSEKPSAIRMSVPLYPYEMQFTKAKGKVVVEFVLMPDGSVRSLRVASSSHAAFNDAALHSVASSDWKPALHDGKPVACKVRIPILFAP